MSNLNVCKAKNPDTCKYHGKHSGAHAKILKAKVKIAFEAYKALEDTPAAYAAYEDYKRAQISFYATDEGLQELKKFLSNDKVETDTEHFKNLYDKALELRNTAEDEDVFIIPPAKIVPLPLPKVDDRRNNVLSNFVNQFNQSVSIRWDSLTFDIELEEGDNLCRVIGRAENLTEALHKATMWYNKNVTLTDN